MKLRVALAALVRSFLAHAQPAEQSSTHGIAIANMDPSVKPGGAPPFLPTAAGPTYSNLG